MFKNLNISRTLNERMVKNVHKNIKKRWGDGTVRDLKVMKVTN